MLPDFIYWRFIHYHLLALTVALRLPSLSQSSPRAPSPRRTERSSRLAAHQLSLRAIKASLSTESNLFHYTPLHSIRDIPLPLSYATYFSSFHICPYITTFTHLTTQALTVFTMGASSKIIDDVHGMSV